MRNRVIFFSGGLASFAVAHHVKQTFPGDNVILYFTDTSWEDSDLYRFIDEVSAKLELPLLIHSKGINPVELMVKQRFMASSRAGTCSLHLKMKVASDFLRKGIVYEQEWRNKHFLKSEDFVSEPVLYFGIGWQEAHREGSIRRNWEPYQVEMPLMELSFSYDKLLKQYGIAKPLLYLLNFAHNNCKGRCIKGGQGHFKNLLEKDEETFIQLMEQEIIISDYIRYREQRHVNDENDYMIKDVMNFISNGIKSEKIRHIINANKYRKNFKFGKRNKPYTFMKSMQLTEVYEMPILLDMFDIGGCGCFVS